MNNQATKEHGEHNGVYRFSLLCEQLKAPFHFYQRMHIQIACPDTSDAP